MDIDNLIIGLEIIRKYQPDASWSAHGGILCCGNYNPSELTEDEQEMMEIDGWYEDDGRWAIEGSIN